MFYVFFRYSFLNKDIKTSTTKNGNCVFFFKRTRENIDFVLSFFTHIIKSTFIFTKFCSYPIKTCKISTLTSPKAI